MNFKRNIVVLLLFFYCVNYYSQIVNSICASPDSIVKKYKDDADKMAVKRVFQINSTFKDSIKINKAISNNYLNALLAVYNATSIPAIDTVINLNLHVYTMYNSLNVLSFYGDSNLVWLKNLRYNIFPTGNAIVDTLMNKYYLKKKYYFNFGNTFSYHSISLKTDTNYNIIPLAAKFATLSGVSYCAADGYFFDGPIIEDSIAINYTQLKYSYGWGDCPSGCMYRRYWTFRVYNDCSVEYVGSYGTPMSVGIKAEDYKIISDKIYPNPFSEKLILEITDLIGSEISILDNLGKIVYYQKSVNSKELNLSTLNAGLYILKVNSNKGFKTFKIIKS